MPLRDLVCILEASPTLAKAALDQAAALARGYSAHASVLVAGGIAAAPFSPFSPAMVGGLVKSENEKLRAQAETIAAGAREALAKAGAKGGVELCLKPFAEIVREVRAWTLCSDLALLDRPGGVIGHGQVLFEEILFSAGRPVLLPAADRAPAEAVGRIALAWDGSPHAARALAYALDFFTGLKAADVVVVRGEKDLSGMVPAAGIAEHIERHGAQAKVAELEVSGEGVASAIDGYAVKAGADLIVMGGFGRSRLREFTLGGVTRDITRDSRTPLLLAH